MAAETAMGAMSEDSSKFGKMLVLVLLPGTQGLYGFIVTVMMLMNIGVLGGSADMSLTKGLLYLTASLPIAVGGLLSGIAPVSYTHLEASDGKAAEARGRGN